MDKLLSGRQYRKKTVGSLLVLLGALLLLSGMLLSVQPSYTYASERLTVEYWLEQEWLDGEPALGEPGCLFEGLLLVAESRGEVLYSGPMNELETLNVTGDFPVYDGEVIEISFTVYLPGAIRRNEYQGAWMETRIRLLARSTNASGEPVECQIFAYPQWRLFELSGIVPGDYYTSTMTVVATLPSEGDLPITGGYAYICLLLWGLFLIALGLLLKRIAREDADSAQA